MNACKDMLAQTRLAYLKIDKIIETSLLIDTILKLCLSSIEKGQIAKILLSQF